MCFIGDTLMLRIRNADLENKFQLPKCASICQGLGSVGNYSKTKVSLKEVKRGVYKVKVKWTETKEKTTHPPHTKTKQNRKKRK